MRRTLMTLAMLAVILVGCEAPPPTDEAEPAETTEEVTPAQIANELRRELRPLESYSSPEDRIPPPVAKKALSGLRASKTKHQVTENGNQALRTMAGEIEDRIRRADEAESWSLVVTLVDALNVIEPGNEVFTTYVERANVHLNRPQAHIRGFYSELHNNETVALLGVYVPQLQQTYNVRVREGEEFLGLRLLRIIGNNKGVVLEYLKTGETFEVYSPREGGPTGPSYSQVYPGQEEQPAEAATVRARGRRRADEAGGLSGVEMIRRRQARQKQRDRNTRRDERDDDDDE